jgi:dye decolorizing peroxidase
VAGHPGQGPRYGQITRRGLLGGVGVALGGAALASGRGVPSAAAAEPGSSLGSATEPFYGTHQAGVATKLQSNATIVALDLHRGLGRADLVRLMRIWTDDAARLTQGTPALADPEATLAEVPARLTITLGYGAGALRAAGLADQAPAWLGPPPKFHGDALQERWTGGDLVLQVAADDPVTVAHAVNVLVRDSADFARVRWVQRGFHRPANTAPAGITGRNLMGQVDGTVNPKPGTPQFEQAVWATQPDWLVGGTGMVVRRIAMDLPVWGSLDQRTKEQAIGRRLADGAPLTGGTETTPADFDAVDANGFPVIPELAHIRLARPEHPAEVILRRPFNYDDGYAEGKPDAGLIFVAFAADVDTQFAPIQRRISKSDVMNIWLQVIGSAVFAIPPGTAPGEYLGQRLLG